MDYQPLPQPPQPESRRSFWAFVVAAVAAATAIGLVWVAMNPASEPVMEPEEDLSGTVSSLPPSSDDALEPSSLSPAASSVAPAPVAPSSTELRAGVSGLTASRTVVTFYQDWVVFRGSPMKAAYYEGSPYLTSALKARLRAHVDRAFDPVTCARKDPPHFQVMTIASKGDGATAHLRETYDSGPVEIDIHLKREDGTWLLDEVVCPASGAASSSL